MAEYATTHQLSGLRDTMDRRIGDLQKEQESMRGEIKEVRKAVFGNGVPGMDEMVRELYNDLQERKKLEKQKVADMEKALKAAGDEDKKVVKETMIERIKGSWQIQVAAISGFFVLLSSVASALLALWLGGLK